MEKKDRVAEFMEGLKGRMVPDTDPHLAGYIRCFNEGLYYEAHDILEDLWLRQGKDHPDYAFHKGLIQLAGGFVHLKLRYLHPDHPKHGRRHAPARRLLVLASENLSDYPHRHLGVDVDAVIRLADETAVFIGEADSPISPWSPSMLPNLHFPCHPVQERR